MTYKQNMITTNIKPMSVNEAWQGKRYKTKKYKKWREDIIKILPGHFIVPEGRMMLCVTFGLSSKNADFDNPLKCFIDALQEKYGFNDRQIYVGMIGKVDVKKGQEFIKWQLSDLTAYDEFMKTCDW
jgi:Holliday junction resolvase RusA-like endonuclease